MRPSESKRKMVQKGNSIFWPFVSIERHGPVTLHDSSTCTTIAPSAVSKALVIPKRVSDQGDASMSASRCSSGDRATTPVP